MPTTHRQDRPQEMPSREREQTPFTFFDESFEDPFDLYGMLMPTVLRK